MGVFLIAASAVAAPAATKVGAANASVSSSPTVSPSPKTTPPPISCVPNPDNMGKAVCDACSDPSSGGTVGIMGMPNGGTCLKCVQDCMSHEWTSMKPTLKWGWCASFCLMLARGCDSLFNTCMSYPAGNYKDMCMLLYLDYCPGK